MKRYKRLYLLLGVLAVACIATFGVLRFEEHQEQIKNSDEIILKVPSDTVTSLSWEYQEESLSFHKEEVWLYDEDEAFPVSEEKINGLLAQFECAFYMIKRYLTIDLQRRQANIPSRHSSNG